jgi:hypothetical protein
MIYYIANANMMMMMMSIGWDCFSDLRPPASLLFTPQWYMKLENHGGIIWTGNSWFVHHSPLSILQAKSSSNKAWGTGEGNYECCLPKYLLHTSKDYLTWRKILWHGAGGFISPSKEGVLWTFIALKIHRLRPGLNSRTLGSMASTLTTRPSRTATCEHT